jgi:hypothetical protein
MTVPLKFFALVTLVSQAFQFLIASADRYARIEYDFSEVFA